MPHAAPCLRRALALLAVLAAASAPAQEPRFTQAQLRSDLAFVVSGIRANHPDPGHSLDLAALDTAVQALSARIDAPLTRDEAWAAFATLNPLFADAHLVISLPDWRGAAAAHLEQGGRFFPFEVSVSPDGAVVVTAALGGAATPYAGARLERINGIAARDIAESILARAHGDGPAFRAGVASRRWWLYYWKLYGAPTAYAIDIQGGPEAVRIDGSRETPLILADEQAFDRQFRFETLPCQSALLTLATFAWPDEREFFAFTRDAFARLEASGSKSLIIDVRENGGGDDSFWLHGVLPYLADKPYRWASTYRKRVLEDHRDEGEVVGTVATGELSTWMSPEPANPLRFDGTVTLLIGRSTYSSAVLLANVMQDFGFARVAGAGPAVRSRQSGGVQRSMLPHTGLVLGWPRFVLDRPSGEKSPALLTPDVVVADDPLRPGAAVEQLLVRDGRGCAPDDVRGKPEGGFRPR